MSSLGTNISNGLNNVRTTFSSWDSCMSKAYCKWPVIAAIVVGSLIALSIVWCFASCLCCGATLCGSCARCLTCFGCCGICGKRGGGGGRTRHKDDYTQVPPTPYNGYQPQPSPMSYQPPSNGAQYAQFDAPGKKIHADSLPAMPTWESARSRRIEDQREPLTGYANDVEMGQMNPAQSTSRARGGYNQVSHGPVSPITSPVGYGHFEGQAQPYNSDIGAQRLGPQQTGYTDFHPTPLSPAPTYRTTPSVVTGGAADRFTTMSPPPSEYNHQQHYTSSRDHAWTPLPAAQHDDPDYQSYRRSLSPPVDHQVNYGYHPQDQSGVRPPSLLQIGRKPVLGSQREI